MDRRSAGMDRRSTQSIGGGTRNSQEPYRSSTTLQLQQPYGDPAATGQPPSSRRSSAASAASLAATQRASMLPAAARQSLGASPLLPPTPPASLASPTVPLPSTPLNTTAAIQRASATAAAGAARRSRQSGMLNDPATTQPPVQRTSMLVQLQQPTAQGGSIVQPVRNI